MKGDGELGNDCFKLEELAVYLFADGNDLAEMEMLMVQHGGERIARVTSLSGERWDPMHRRGAQSTCSKPTEGMSDLVYRNLCVVLNGTSI